jgi:GntR family transcriptional regulator, rspAB operon transcriptional repressor
MGSVTSSPETDFRRARLRGGGSTRDLVYAALRQRIIELELRPATPLSEAEIASGFGVSRTPVREALLLLAEQGLVEVYPQKGTFVGPIVYEAVVSAQFIREALECASLERGAGNIDASAIRELRELLRRQHAADERRDAREFFRLDEEFHQLLMVSGGQQAAWRFVSQAKAQMDRARRLSLPEGDKMAHLIVQHTAIVDDLEAERPAEAVQSLREHLRVVLSDIGRMREDNPDLFDDDNGHGARG